LQVTLEEGSHGFDTHVIKGRQKATERAAMREMIASKEGHKSRGKGVHTLIERLQSGFAAERIAKEHGQKINHLIPSHPTTGKLDLLLKGVKQSQAGEKGSHDGNFPKPGRKRCNGLG